MIRLLDLHCDTITKCMDNNAQMYENPFHNSFKRLLEYESPVQVFAVYTDDIYVDNAYNYTKNAINYFYEQLKKYSDYAEIFDINNMEKNKVNSVLAIEGGEPVDSLERLDEFINLGVKIITLTWNRKNKLGCGALSGFDEGLTDFGKAVVRKMNRDNIVVDVSHLNEEGFKDVANISQKPFIASHSNAAHIYNHKRNLADWQIKEIADSGGIIGVNIYPDFMGEKSIYKILKHIDYILNINNKCVCLGCDFDGISVTPDEIKNVSDLTLLYEIISQNFGTDTAEDIFYKNGLNFLQSM